LAGAAVVASELAELRQGVAEVAVREDCYLVQLRLPRKTHTQLQLVEAEVRLLAVQIQALFQSPQLAAEEAETLVVEPAVVLEVEHPGMLAVVVEVQEHLGKGMMVVHQTLLVGLVAVAAVGRVESAGMAAAVRKAQKLVATVVLGRHLQ
jgi:hypothetical protein